MTDENRISNDNQYRGDKELDKKLRDENKADGSESLDKKHTADQENLRSIT
ncbi:MAG: elastin-binding protein EbpS, partial [Anaerococcus vaginalis]